MNESMNKAIHLHYSHHSSPTAVCVTIDGIHQALGDGLEELLRLHVGLIEGLTDPKEVGRGCSGDDKVFGKVEAPYDVG